MIRVVPATAEMATQIWVDGKIGLPVSPEFLGIAISNGMSLAVVEGDKILGIGGLLAEWPGRYIAWTIIAHDVNKAQFRHLHATVKRVLDASKYPRIEMHVLKGFIPGCRWARKLGFQYEGCLRNWFGGQDFEMWARTA